MKTGLESKSEQELYAMRRKAKFMKHLTEFGPWSWNIAADALIALITLEFDLRVIPIYIERERANQCARGLRTTPTKVRRGLKKLANGQEPDDDQEYL